MRRIIVVFTLTLTSLISVSGQSPKSRGQRVRPKGKILVTKLPDRTEGVTLVSGRIKLRPGYKFVKQDDGTVTVARMRGGGGPSLSGGWDCSCAAVAPPGQDPPAGGTCKVEIAGDSISCFKDTCQGFCVMSITISGLKTGVIRY